MVFARALLGAALAFAVGSTAVHAAPVEVKVGQPLARFDTLKPGAHRYLRYMRAGETLTPIDIWTREVRFEDKDGARRLRIVQHWDAPGKPNTGKRLDSWFETGTFRPLTHERRTTKDDQTKVEAYAFSPDKVTGLADVADNAAKDYAVDSPQPTFNFEVDMEVLQALPLAAGYEASLVFLHPGSGKPEPYVFKVVGSETVAVPGAKLDCWIVQTDYNRSDFPPTRFWLAKTGQQVIKVVQPLPTGAEVIKVLIE
jgi:hypothetical protein